MPPVASPGAPPVEAAEFAALMDVLGPFGAAPPIAVACSGGADSTALALLASRWAADRGGSVLALVVDHGLRAESAAEAALTLRRLAARGIAGRLLELDGLRRGPALAERARGARYTALAGACREAGIVHLLLGHHARDQAETVAMRHLARSGTAGLAGMAAVAEHDDIRLLRPLLGIAPARLRATLRAAAMAWVEDPSNREPAALRARLRAEPGARAAEMDAMIGMAARNARSRAMREGVTAQMLAGRVVVRPEGFAVIGSGPLAAAALAALIQAISGSRYAPSPPQLAPLAAAPRPATLGGARLLPGGRMGTGLLVVREAAAQSGPVPARPGARWDGRFRLGLRAAAPEGAVLGALGAAAVRLRGRSALPSVILRALPALWLGETLFAVPHIGYPDARTCRELPLDFCPRRPAAGTPWFA